jgi:hypothetical protein
MGTKRVPIRRPPVASITPAALVAFEAMDKLGRACTCEPIDWGGKYWERGPQCSSCQEWWRQHSILHHELRCKPWQWPCIEHPSARSPYPRGSEADKRCEPDLEAQELWRQLEAARKAQRKAAREARQRAKAAEQPPPPPATRCRFD